MTFPYLALVFTALLVLQNVEGFPPNSLYSVYGWLGSHHEEVSICSLNNIAIYYLDEYDMSRSTLPSCTTLSQVLDNCKLVGLSCQEYSAVQKTITDANAQVDKQESKNPFAHFDAESFYDANQNMITMKQAAIRAMLESSDYITARKNVGKVMHTLQDFYSHTNWVENGNSRVNIALTRHNDMGTVSEPTEATCRDCQESSCIRFCVPFTEKCTDNYCPPSGCLEIFDFHVCSPFYTCEDNLQTSHLTSGFFGGQSIAKPDGAGKCSHGGVFDSSSSISATGGINKDTNLNMLSPHYQFHGQAARLARDATFDLLKDIWDQVGDKHFGRFLGLTGGVGSLVIVMDTTGSMNEEIDAAKETAKALADEMVNQNEPPVNYILSPFNDPGVGPLTVTEDANIFKAKIDQLRANGGGDLPEMCLSGILDALEACEYNSNLFVFTDAEAKDDHLSTQVLSLASKKSTEINFLLTDVFSLGRAIDKDLYQSLSAATGGQMVSTTNEEITEVSLSIINAEDIVKQTVSLVQAVVDSAPSSGFQTFMFTAESTLDQLTIEASATSGTLTALGITGPTTLNITRTSDLTTVKIYKVYPVPNGGYTVTVTTRYPFTLKVTGVSSFAVRSVLGTVKFDGHPGFFTTESEPVADSTIWLVTDILDDRADNVTMTTASLVDEEGEVFSKMTLTKIGESRYAANFTVPSTSFRILAEGEYSFEGNAKMSTPFQRIQPNLFTPSFVDVVVADEQPPTYVQINRPLTLNFLVTNYGPRALVTMAAVDTASLVTSPAISNYIERNENYTFSVILKATSEFVTPIGSVTTVTISASTTTTTNFATASLIVMPEFIDSSSPTIELTSDSSDNCEAVDQSKCASKNWSLRMLFNDSESGLKKLMARNQQLGEFGENCTRNCSDYFAVFNYDPFPEGDTFGNVTAYFEASCCVEVVEIVATDVAGNLRVREVGVSFKTATGSSDDTAIIVGAVVGSVVGIAIIIAVIGFYMRHKKKKKAPADIY